MTPRISGESSPLIGRISFVIPDDTMPPRNPDDDNDEEEDEEEDEDENGEEDRTDEPPVVREPDED